MERLAFLARRMQDLDRERSELVAAVQGFDEAVRPCNSSTAPSTTTTITASTSDVVPSKSLTEALLPIYE